MLVRAALMVGTFLAVVGTASGCNEAPVRGSATALAQGDAIGRSLLKAQPANGPTAITSTRAEFEPAD